MEKVLKYWIPITKFDSNNRILIPLSSLFYLHFDQMGGTWPIWSHYPIDPIIRYPIKRSLLYYLPTYTLYFLRGLGLVTSLFFPSVEFYFDNFFSVIAVGHSPRHGRVEIGRFGLRRDPEDASALSEAVPEKTLRSKMHLHRLRAIPKCCRKN